MTSCARRLQRLRWKQGQRPLTRWHCVRRMRLRRERSAMRPLKGRCLHSKLWNKYMPLMAICARHLQMLRQRLSQRLHGRPHCARHTQLRRDCCAQRPQSCASRSPPGQRPRLSASPMQMSSSGCAPMFASWRASCPRRCSNKSKTLPHYMPAMPHYQPLLITAACIEQAADVTCVQKWCLTVHKRLTYS